MTLCKYSQECDIFNKYCLLCSSEQEREEYCTIYKLKEYPILCRHYGIEEMAGAGSEEW